MQKKMSLCHPRYNKAGLTSRWQAIATNTACLWFHKTFSGVTKETSLFTCTLKASVATCETAAVLTCLLFVYNFSFNMACTAYVHDCTIINNTQLSSEDEDVR